MLLLRVVLRRGTARRTPAGMQTLGQTHRSAPTACLFLTDRGMLSCLKSQKDTEYNTNRIGCQERKYSENALLPHRGTVRVGQRRQNHLPPFPAVLD
ncbi:MAG: hypothetical protein D3906_15390 [Candidatus Electrothrix sp. AUS1_2]|nr:hypothetical protein [Candidatus Electrothrix sp. AUS1_2]